MPQLNMETSELNMDQIDCFDGVNLLRRSGVNLLRRTGDNFSVFSSPETLLNILVKQRAIC